jgi:Peptidase A4 family
VNRVTMLVAVTAAASIAALGTASAPAWASASGSAARGSTHPSSAASAAQAARAALRHVTANPPASDEQVPGTTVHGQGVTKVQSDNWSGYADNDTGGRTYKKVSADWTQPSVSCPTDELQLAAFWVGIDGFTDGTVEQDGTLAECYEGTAYYYTWWEMYPTNDIQVVGESVQPGDEIVASVVKSGTHYKLKVTDSTSSGNNVNTTQHCKASKCVDSSAEWIGEAPGGTRGEYPLPDFGTWRAKSASVTSGSTTGSISKFSHDQITMEGNDYSLATPGSLTSGGTAFTDTWDNSY